MEKSMDVPNEFRSPMLVKINYDSSMEWAVKLYFSNPLAVDGNMTNVLPMGLHQYTG